MKLSTEDADLYFDLMWRLMCFGNHQLGLVAEVDNVDAYKALPQEDKMAVRKAVFDQPALIEQYVQVNPDHLSDDELAIVGQWKNFIQREFYIERHLKRYSIFIDDKDNVYGVIGLYESLEDIIHKSYLPTYVKTILLPFKGQVIYDGLIKSASIFFGSGIKSELKEVYLRAKQRGEITTSFEKSAKASRSSPVSKLQDWRSEVEQLDKLAKGLRGGAEQPAIFSPVFSLVKASLELALVAVTEPSNEKELYQKLKKVNRAFRKVEAAIYRM